MFRKGALFIFILLGLVGARFAFATDQSSLNFRNIGPTFAPTVKDISSASYLMTASFDAIVGASIGTNYTMRSGVPINDTDPVTPSVVVPGGVAVGDRGGGLETPASSFSSVTFRGRAYPLSSVTILKDGQIAITTIAGPDAIFDITLSGLSSGNFTFSVYGENSQGRRSSLFTFPVFVTQWANTIVSGIFLSPTIDVDKDVVKQGDIVQIFGQSTPAVTVTIQVNSKTIFLNTNSDPGGVYLYAFNTSVIDLGAHTTKSSASASGTASSYSPTVGFLVNDTGIGKPKSRCSKADLNCDGRVNLTDFSIAAYWYTRALSATLIPIEIERLNGDGKINLTDFSILAYYWTG